MNFKPRSPPAGRSSARTPEAETARCFGRQATPDFVNGLTNVVQVMAGRSRACAVTAAGGLKCWGSAYKGLMATAQRPASGAWLTRVRVPPTETFAAGVGTWMAK